MTTIDTAGAARPTEPAADAASRRRRGYGRLWAAVPRELGYLLLGFPIAIVAFTVLVTLFSTGASLLVIVVGLAVVVAALYTARGFGILELVRLEWAGRTAIRRPNWDAASPAGEGPWRAFFAPFVDGHYWLYLLHGMVVAPIVALFSWTVTVVWLAVGLGGVTYWFWAMFVPTGGRDFWPHEWVLDRVWPGGSAAVDVQPLVGESIAQFVLGAVFLLALPFVTTGLTWIHDRIGRGMLGAWRSEALERQVQQLAASRGAAVQAEDAALRRLERDIHDGPQQRLVRLQMDLAAIDRKLETDPDAARALLGEARDQARDTLDELRALSRGFAPPLLQDRGLASALESVAGRSPVPVTLELALPADAALPAAIERNAYFIAAELLTNAAKHSGASAIRLRLATRDTGASGHWLDLWVTDNGHGGATATPGHGLAGLDERVRGLGGVLLVDSPAGGPTVIGAHFPYVPDAMVGA
ncbi:sensor histidine kinase [Agromyces aurantiacus]|uniref:histidine kinase n=1 Tax=Agromyces aurantiacus TaxID=165814 RepID=A0ABV9RCR6_9MICO|nr:sensor histidine kinase [Agromyces aurantiacus]MBM7504972.1 signal transduction histidine kinase [Agromyces aurantiacus]